jgi:hypothetical protein
MVGRPKKNDSERLQALAKLLRKDPELKVTTALRALDIVDPSEIRRLRDKHRKFRRVIPGKSSPSLDQVYLTAVFDRLKRHLHPTAVIYFRDDGIAMFGGRAAQTLCIPGRASAVWVKTVFIPKATQFLRNARDHHILDGLQSDMAIDDIGAAFGISAKRVQQIKRRTA